MYHYSVINLFNVNYIIKREEYTEIEKKFLVSGDYKIHVKSSNKIIRVIFHTNHQGVSEQGLRTIPDTLQ